LSAPNTIIFYAIEFIMPTNTPRTISPASTRAVI
jgi:hypothetical protein